jgi:hypothetical protein
MQKVRCAKMKSSGKQNYIPQFVRVVIITQPFFKVTFVFCIPLMILPSQKYIYENERNSSDRFDALDDDGDNTRTSLTLLPLHLSPPKNESDGLDCD